MKLCVKAAIAVLSTLVLGGCVLAPPQPGGLTFEDVARVQQGQTRADVQRLLGEPRSKVVLPRLQQEVWTYKYYDRSQVRPHMDLYVYFNIGSGLVSRTEAGTDKDFDPGGRGGRA